MNMFNDYIKIDYKKNMGITGITDEFFCLYLTNFLDKYKSDILVVVDSIYEANKIYSSLKKYTDKCLLFPMDDFLTSEALAVSPDLEFERLDCLKNSIINNDNYIVITNIMGYLRYLPNKDTFKNSILNLKNNDVINHKVLVDKLINLGYVKDTLVDKTGEYGVRGFIIDIFPLDEDYPVRIEFFDDEIDSIRYFDPETQKSIKSINEVTILPCWEFITLDKNVDELHLGKQKFLPKYDRVQSIYDYLNIPYVFYKDYDQLKISYLNICNQIIEYKEKRDIFFDGNYMFDFNDINPENYVYYMNINNISNNGVDVVDFNVKSVPLFHENADSINDFIRKSISNGKTIVIGLKKYQFKSAYKFLNMKVIESDIKNIELNQVNLIDYDFNNGFIYNDLILITSKELFDIKQNPKKHNNKFKYGMSIKDLNKLEIGDYVVHINHGIGIYNGIKTISLNNLDKDYIEVLYQGKDKLYIPVEKIDILYKYSGKDGSIPKVNKLGGNDWEKTKARVRNRVNDMADKLLDLYSKREASKGFAFSKDNELMTDFENEFPYDLTKDQSIAISQIKGDMEKQVPMDRLLCGDVGFGKTEVAFVASFKAILDSKQVLFLCPTTILSNQHYENALKRFKNYPVSIALLNRFTPKRKVIEIVNGLKDGTIDLVFGTHRLLSDDIMPKNLGLLVIDEEQRFGVAHKEKIKSYKNNVDVLTLTATPIPRTLQMSMVGIRSLSLIETPPVNRYPVQTYVVEENDQIIKDAIYKELSRNGQVFILYNKVESIDRYASEIQKLAPDASVVIAHGQMSKTQLENTIYDFINHKFDILICTTIIETGIDIPNVNTLIIIDADRFGLSQLYQIRGRVGRSDKFAYAYLFYKKSKVLTETAVKRLNVIKEFTELGSGFSIATRDLSIRGAGDILGSEQAGFIDSVGIDLYLKMLNDEVAKRKNIDNNNLKSENDVDKQPLLSVSTHISDGYVLDDDLKIEIHRKINEIDSKEKLNSVLEELEDRFGKIDDNMLVYMYEEWFEKLADLLKIRHVNQNKNSIELVFPEETVKCINTEDVFVESFKISPMFRFMSRGSNLIIILDIIKLDKHPIYYLVDLLDYIKKTINNNLT